MPISSHGASTMTTIETPGWLATISLGEVVTTIVFVVGLIYGLRKANANLRGINNLLDDINGVPDRPGVPGRKGVMERLSEQDEALARMQDTLDQHLRETDQQGS